MVWEETNEGCPICFKRFRFRANLTKHMRKVHRIKIKNKTKWKRRCPNHGKQCPIGDKENCYFIHEGMCAEHLIEFVENDPVVEVFEFK